VPSVDALPEVRDSAGAFGKTRGLHFLPDGIPITGALGDQQAALAGQTCFRAGEGKCTYGTGAFYLLNLGPQKLVSRAGVLTTVAWSLGGKLTYAFEGSAFIAGAAVQFLRDQLHMIGAASETEGLARGAQAAPEVYFVPSLAGLGAPYWDPRAQGAFLGLTRGTTKAQLVRAALEGIAFEVTDLVNAMRQDLKEPVAVLRVDGGAAANDLLMQAQADFAGLEVDRPVNLETTAFGAALFAGLGAGVYSDLNTLRSVRKTERAFKPSADAAAKALIEKQLAGWRRAVRAVQAFAE
jgi:glycerol kinase